MTVVASDRELDELISRLGELESGAGLRALAQNIAEEAVEQVKQGFEDERDPYGNAWPGLKCRDGRILRDTGAMLNSLHVSSATAAQAKIAMGVWYAVVHQTGKTIVPKRAKRLRFMAFGVPTFAKSVTIPARPFFPRVGDLPGEWAQSFDEVTGEWFRMHFGR